MPDDGRIDIFQEFVSLSNQEQMLAFFDFQLEASGRLLSGLCRVSKPKGSDRSTSYVSLTFVVDTPDEPARRAIEGALANLETDTLKAAVPGVQELLSVPVIDVGADNYVQQADVLLERGIKPDEMFLGQRLIPAIQKITRIKAADVVWWETSAAPPASAKPAPAQPEGSLLSSIRQYFNRDRT